ncbi:4'-phosphopantetheinyl transferase family protein [Pedobacter metabolipauper]|uniref:4'-phosphopantetheinyl transferase superfamily protein n=1 Tax=Pedobacter metabolipauper TaxID=425513 RepID=A0A4R6SPC5_9SPHI|nr:4'-phosphopantetheinyl transferase superfamily protein [Pedobacter metabolipauper]TDQ06383.1 4'-phosphopantetheinyl transferase superfamily protein [Pedobacter metabolipauper]
MIGNDIVDLNQALKDSDWNRKDYLKKIFTAEEQFMISSGTCSNLLVWLLWTMKESAYKVHARKFKLREFAPLKISCRNLIVHEHHAIGEVNYDEELYYTSSTLQTDYIHTLAAIDQTDLTLAKVMISAYDTSDYRSTGPASVSHHGKYLALAYL